MALTKISTGGVKDDAASQAIIADEAVDEARLQISNAGNNGQFLQKTGNTGGLTWADAASEGTEIKSTGESGTAKFLRVDGDGTSSWQPVPSDNTKANLSGADFTGEVALKGSSTQAKFYDPSDTSHSIHFKAPSLTANSEYTLPTADGSANQVLKTSGSGALSWTTISAAPTITATANGAISANDPVIVNSDGDIEKVTGNDNNIYNNVVETDEAKNGQVAYDSDRDKYVFFYRNDDESKKLCAKIGTLTGEGANTAGSITWSSRIVITSHNIDAVRAIYDTYSDKFLIVYTNGSGGGGGLQANSVKINTAGDGLDIGYHSDIDTSTIYPGSWEGGLSNKCDSNAVACMAWRNGDYTRMKGIRLSSSSTSLTISSQVTLYDTGGPMMPVTNVYEEHSQKFMIVTTNGGGGNKNKGWIASAYTSGTNGSTMNANTSSPTQIDSDHEISNCSGAYDSNTDRTLILWNGAGTTESKSIVLATNGNTGFTAGTKVKWADSSATELDGSPATIFYPADNNLYCFYSRASDSKPVYAKFKITASSNSSEVLVSPTLMLSDTTTSTYHTVAYDSTNVRLIITYQKTNESNRGYYFVYQPTVTNITTDNFIGFASAAISDNASGTVAVTGNTVTSSSLTPGKKYYVTTAGALSTTAGDPSVVAGVSLSATKLLIKG